MFVLRKVKALYFRSWQDCSPWYSPEVQTRQCEVDVPCYGVNTTSKGNQSSSPTYISGSLCRRWRFSTEDSKLSVPQEFLQRRVFIISTLLSSHGERNLTTVSMNIATTRSNNSVYRFYLFLLSLPILHARWCGCWCRHISGQYSYISNFSHILHRNLFWPSPCC